MIEFFQLLLGILNVAALSIYSYNCLKSLNTSFILVQHTLDDFCSSLFSEKHSLKLSSGPNFNSNFKAFSTLLLLDLRKLSIHDLTIATIKLSPSNYIRVQLLNSINIIQSRIRHLCRINLNRNMKMFINDEIVDITKSLNGDNFFNMSGFPVPASITSKLNLGRKYCPYYKPIIKNEKISFHKEACSLLESYFKSVHFLALNLDSRRLVKSLDTAILSLEFGPRASLIPELKHTKNVFLDIKRKFLSHLRSLKSGNLPLQRDLKSIFNLDDDRLILEADKNVGYVCLLKSDIHLQYEKINKDQHFGKTSINENWYITNIRKFIEEAKSTLPTELSNIIKPKDFEWDFTNAEIGVLRLQPKILKLNSISRVHISQLKSRGIKSSMKDPIKVIQIILDKIFSHLLYYIETEFVNRFGFNSPSVTGVEEAITRVKNSKTGLWGHSLELEGDFTDLYSNCNKELLILCVTKACRFAKMSLQTVDYICLLITCIMSHSYFKEPSGLFQTLKGFSMGDSSAARGSEIILRIYEISIFSSFSSLKLLPNVSRYLRFRDDVSLHFTGSPVDILKCVRLVCCGYPPCMVFNLESKLIYGKFLNIRIYNDPTSSHPVTSVLRKPNNKYNITPPTSNTHGKYKRMAGSTYFRTARTHTSSTVELLRQYKVIRHILKLKGFSMSSIFKMQRSRSNPNTFKKRFLSKTVYNSVTSSHRFIHMLARNCNVNLELFYLPMEIPQPKLDQFIFTVRKMREKLGF